MANIVTISRQRRRQQDTSNLFSHINSCTISCNRMPLPQAVSPYRYPTDTQAVHSSCQRWSIGPCVRN